WRDPVELTFHAVVWDHPRPVLEQVSPNTRQPLRPGSVLARVVELGIEVIADASDDLAAVLRRETLSALRRLNLSVGLRNRASVQRTRAFDGEWTEVAVKWPSLKDRAIRAETANEGKKTLLQQIVTPLDATAEPAYEVEKTVDEIAKALGANP